MTRYIHCVTRDSATNRILTVGWNTLRWDAQDLSHRDRESVAKDIEVLNTHEYKTAGLFNLGDTVEGYQRDGEWFIKCGIRCGISRSLLRLNTP